ncbi:hypothetical protein VNI00_012683 [Paramarasmius palmivorus]|uniref:C2H2-type domain-containing protein n=1 Tax=Paramarasmius palmivorus TaxID=297713 RepID=A0AAW0C531_9AGAR
MPDPHASLNGSESFLDDLSSSSSHFLPWYNLSEDIKHGSILPSSDPPSSLTLFSGSAPIAGTTDLASPAQTFPYGLSPTGPSADVVSDLQVGISAFRAEHSSIDNDNEIDGVDGPPLSAVRNCLRPSSTAVESLDHDSILSSTDYLVQSALFCTSPQQSSNDFEVFNVAEDAYYNSVTEQHSNHGDIGPLAATNIRDHISSKTIGSMAHAEGNLMPDASLDNPSRAWSFLETQQKRRRPDEVERKYKCNWSHCRKSYGSLNHLNTHVLRQKHGPKRSPDEFRELRKQWKKERRGGSTVHFINPRGDDAARGQHIDDTVVAEESRSANGPSQLLLPSSCQIRYWKRHVRDKGLRALSTPAHCPLTSSFIMSSSDNSFQHRVEHVARRVYHPRKHPIDHTLEGLLDRLCRLSDEERSEAPKDEYGHLVSTYDQPRRRIFRFWPRDPEGTIFRGLPEGKFKAAPNATHLWGATLYDFYHTYRIPSLESLITKTTGNRMFAWCKMVGELDTAQDEIACAEMEEEPRKIQAADIIEIHQCTVDFNLRLSNYGKTAIAAAKERGFPAPRLETTIPLHLLPQRLIVHDPHNVLHAERSTDTNEDSEDSETGSRDGSGSRADSEEKSGEEPKVNSKHESQPNPWPFDCSNPTEPLPYPTHTYALQLTQQSLDKISQTRRELASLHSDQPVENVLFIYPSKNEGPTHTPLIRVTVPSRPPKTLKTEEAHLFLTKHRKKGEGNHSLVYGAEWELPREIFEDPKICYACVESKAKQVWKEQKHAAGSGLKGRDPDVDALRVKLTESQEDVVLPPELEADDERLEAFLRELEARIDPQVLAPLSPPSESLPADHVDPQPSRIERCGFPHAKCNVWDGDTDTKAETNFGSIWLEAHRISSRPDVKLHVRSAEKAREKILRQAKEAKERGEKKEWVYSDNVTPEMKEKFESDRKKVFEIREEQKKDKEKEKGKGKEKESNNVDIDVDMSREPDEDVKMSTIATEDDSDYEFGMKWRLVLYGGFFLANLFLKNSHAF